MCDKCAGQAQRIRGDTHTRTHTLPHTHPCRDTKSCSTRRCRWHSKIPLGLVDNYDWVSAAYTHTAAASGSGINIAKHLNIFDWCSWRCQQLSVETVKLKERRIKSKSSRNCFVRWQNDKRNALTAKCVCITGCVYNSRYVGEDGTKGTGEECTHEWEMPAGESWQRGSIKRLEGDC